MNARERGFTLVELLLATSIAVAVFLAVTSSLVQGIKIFNRINAMANEEAPAFFLERFTHDLKNAAPYSLVPFAHTENSVTFASLAPQNMEETGADSPAIMRPSEISYQFDRETNQIRRSQNFYPFDAATRKTEVVMRGVGSFELDVLSVQGALPARVTVSLKLIGASGASFGQVKQPAQILVEKEIKKQILIPLGYATSA